VLIVEDEPVIAEYLTACIQEMGFDVVGPVAGCTEALAILSEVKPQLAVTRCQSGRGDQRGRAE
jgi:DNA-binding response OmpR family regulator